MSERAASLGVMPDSLVVRPPVRNDSGHAPEQGIARFRLREPRVVPKTNLQFRTYQIDGRTEQPCDATTQSCARLETMTDAFPALYSLCRSSEDRYCRMSLKYKCAPQ